MNREDPSAAAPAATEGSTGRVVVLHPALAEARQSRRAADGRLAEAVGLAAAIELKVVHAEVVTLPRPRPSTLFGQGAVERLAGTVSASRADLVLVDRSLSPVQQRNLEKAWKTKVIDRTGLILEIFGARARTKEGSLQVELAALNYQRSRLVRSWTHLERQRGGFGFLGGPGESQLEIDRRLISERITRIKAELEKVKRRRGLHRRARQRVPYPVVALVGYTNAGKSTLFNRITGDAQLAHDMLFATLDPTMRLVRLPGGLEAILSDTVGFISDLPTDLVAAFRATLEEVVEADLILHVRDVANADSEAQRQDVLAILADLGLEAGDDEPMLEALNKIDCLTPEQQQVVRERAARKAEVLACSALTGDGVPDLLQAVETRLVRDHKRIELTLGPEEGAAIAWLHEHGRVLERREIEGKTRMSISLSPAALARFEQRYGAHRKAAAE